MITRKSIFIRGLEVIVEMNDKKSVPHIVRYKFSWKKAPDVACFEFKNQTYKIWRTREGLGFAKSQPWF